MNFEKFINSDYLKENPLCGIDTYKDELNLTTGACTRQIKKLELTGEESTGFYGKNYTSSDNSLYYIRFTAMQSAPLNGSPLYCTHLQNINYTPSEVVGIQVAITYNVIYFNLGLDVMNAQPSGNTVAGLKEYLAAQYAAGTPVTVWYVLATPTIETITVPSGLSGTVEGYLNQSGTPTPTNPIYPTANTIEQWFDLNHYIMGTSTDTITTLPADIYANDTTATVGLKGQAVQSSTPSPTSPIMPNGTGERTDNLAPPLLEWINGYVASNGSIAGADETYKEKSSDYISIDAGKVYTFSMQNGFPGGTNYSWRAIGWYAQDKTFISRASGNTNVALSTNAPSNAVYCRLSYRTHGETANPMLNTGSQPLPYEPYGYKIPISMGGTTNNVYLGEVQTVRQIKKLAFDGTENWQLNNRIASVGGKHFNLSIATQERTEFGKMLCSHYPVANPYDRLTACCVIANYSQGIDIRVNNPSTVESITDFKSYLQQQYAAGTPVTVWYVLATPTTGIVNEPLMKIGDYADSLTTTVSCAAGENTLDVQTTVQPSEVTATWMGWHNAEVKEWDGSQWD